MVSWLPLFYYLEKGRKASINIINIELDFTYVSDHLSHFISGSDACPFLQLLNHKQTLTSYLLFIYSCSGHGLEAHNHKQT